MGATRVTSDTIDLLEMAKEMSTAGQYDGAITAYREALTDLEDNGASPLAGSTHNDMAVAMFQMGDIDGAAEHMLKAVFLHGHFKQWTDYYLSLLSLAQVCRARGEHRMAITCRINAGKVRAHLAKIQPMNRLEEARLRSFQRIVDTAMMRQARSQ